MSEAVSEKANIQLLNLHFCFSSRNFFVTCIFSHRPNDKGKRAKFSRKSLSANPQISIYLTETINFF